MDNTFIDNFVDQSVRYMGMSIDRIGKCFDHISEEELWYSPNAHTNSIGNLTLHLSGNINQYINAGLGKSPDTRDRDSEFVAKQNYSKKEVLEKLTAVFKRAQSVINSRSTEELNCKYELQGFEMTGLEAVLHVTEHLSYHTGQIALLTKILRKDDLGFYAGKDLNKKNI